MEERVTASLKRLRPRIKQRWEALLRAQPVASPLASPDTLVFLMDETLDQLGAAGRSRSIKTWLHRNPTLLAPYRGQCACGANPLLAYYSTGGVALTETVQAELGDAFEMMMLFYHAIAQKDLDALCGVCCNKGTATCTERQIALEPAAEARVLGR